MSRSDSTTFHPGLINHAPFVEYSEEGAVLVDPQLKTNVCYLAIRAGSSNYALIGTTFAIAEIVGGKGIVYLVTCRHVVQEAINRGEQIYLRVNRMHEPGVEFVPLGGEWKFHPSDLGKDPTDKKNESMVDLAVIKLEDKPYPKPVILGWHDIRNLLAVKITGGDLRDGEEIVSIGLFRTHPGHARNFPIARFGNISLVTKEQIPGVEPWLGCSDYFLSELKIYKGMSGAPVYTLRRLGAQNIWVLLGIAAGYYDEREEKEEPFGHYGISLIVPVQKLEEIIFGDELTKEREQYIREREKAKRAVPASSGTEEPESKQVGHT